MCRVNSTGEDICKLSTPDDATRLQTQLKFLNTHWANVCQQLNEQKRRCVSMAAGFFFLVYFLFNCCFCLLRGTRCSKILMNTLKFLAVAGWFENVVRWL